MKKIVLNEVNKVYNPNQPNEFYALKNICLEVDEAQIVLLKGVSGSGKSTLLSLLGGLSKPTCGEILVNDQNIAKLPDLMASDYRHREVGFVFQSFQLLEGLSVYQNVLAPLSLLKLSKEQMRQKIDVALEIANIAHKKEQKVSLLSGGERQRCAIARALVMEPGLILADEPTANLDKANGLLFIEMLRRFKALNKTVLIATHDVIFDELECVDRIVHLKEGMIV
jgi:putative ABC transport system ATP-binding protein